MSVNIKNEYLELKKQLIPIDELKQDNNNMFYHKNKLSTLSDNQAITHMNIGESLIPIMDGIVDYIKEIKSSNYIEVSFSNKNRFLAQNNKINYFQEGNLVSNNLMASQIINYASILKQKDGIDTISIKINASITKNGSIISCEPVIMFLDFENKIVNIIDNETQFTPTSIFSFIIVGIKVKEEITTDDKVDCNITYKSVLHCSDLSNKTEEGVVFQENNYKFNFNIKQNEIPFFNVLNIFGNNLSMESKNKTKYDVSDYNFYTDQNSKGYVASIILNNVLRLKLENYGKFLVFSKNGRKMPFYNIRFDLYSLDATNSGVHYPNVSPLAYKVIRIVDEL